MPGFADGLMGMPSQVAQYLPRAYRATLTPASIATITTAEQTFSVPGLQVGDNVTVTPPGITAGTGIVGARVTAADTIGITFGNPTAGSLTPAAGVHLIIATKCV